MLRLARIMHMFTVHEEEEEKEEEEEEKEPMGLGI